MIYSLTSFPLLLVQYGLILGVATAAFVSNYAQYTTANQHRMSSMATTTTRSIARTVPSFTKRHAQSSSHDAENDECMTQEPLLHPIPNNQKTETHDVALYIHIPYCRQRCRYCDFAIVPIGNSVMSFTNNGNNDNQSQQEKGFLQMDHTYREAILKELSLIQKYYNNHLKLVKDQQPQQQKIRLRSIYFGGGTPSLAPLETIEAIMNMILGTNDSNNDGIFDVVSDDPSEIEITMEIDPGTFTLSKLQSLKNLGINRLSLGIQSFDDSILGSIGRVHRYQDIVDSLQMIQQVYGYNDDSDDDETNNNTDINYSIDLISGLPGLTLAKWVETLQIATNLVPRPSHISLYDLQIESGTVFGQWYDDNDDDDDEDNDGGDFASIGQTRGASPLPTTASPSRLPSASDCAFMYKFASGYLRSKGYEHYEISSYAARLDSEMNQRKDALEKPPSKRSKHNQIYWEPGSEWYAVGLGATSSIGGHRHARPRALSDYANWVNLQQNVDNPDWLAAPASVIDGNIDDDDIDDDDYLTDIVMTRLRTSDGLDLNWIKHNIPDGSRKVEAILRGAELGLDLGLAEVFNPSLDAGKSGSYGDSEILRLIDPDGFVFSNSIISSIFLELEEL